MAVTASTPFEPRRAGLRPPPRPRGRSAASGSAARSRSPRRSSSTTCATPQSQELERGRSYADFDPDRVAMQDATAQMALLQFMTAGLPEVAVPTTVHCDHLIQAKVEANIDLKFALDVNSEVYDFLRSVSAKYGIGFWKPGSGIIHQVVLENYAFPGGMMIGTDSHTPNAGGLGMVAIGVGGADAVDVMTGFPFNVRWPKLIGVHLTGALSGWTAPKDVILKVAEVLTVKGGTGAIVEYFGPGADTITATGKGTICNMGAEIGATTSLFPYDANMAAYLKATGREEIADAANAVAQRPARRPRGRARSGAVLRPGDRDRPVDARAADQRARHARPRAPGRPRSARGRGRTTCRPRSRPRSSARAPTRRTRTSRAPRRSRGRPRREGLRAKTQLLVTPGSEQVRATIERDGLLADLEAIGGTVLANACGPCIGQWDRTDLDPSKVNTIVNSYNRNFPKRNDGNANTKAFVTSPDMVIAYALAGTLEFNPLTDEIDGVRLEPPVGEDLPARGFDPGESGFLAPPDERVGHRGRRRPRLRAAAAARAVPGVGRQGLRRPARAAEGQGQVHDRPHLGRRQVAALPRPPREHLRQPVPRRRSTRSPARPARARIRSTARPGRSPTSRSTSARRACRWCAVGDENYGEGSSREHAAMEPRFRGGVVIFARSFARIHETNLKKQGILPLTFADPATYDQIGEDDRISVLGLADLAPDTPVQCRITKPDGTTIDFETVQTFSPEQIEWFRAGSALNIIRAKQTG